MSYYYLSESEEDPDFYVTEEYGWTYSGKWGYWNGKIVTKVDDYIESLSATLKNGELIITEIYSDETVTSTFKKTKLSK